MANLNIIKRSGEEVLFDRNKIVSAVTRANAAAEVSDRISDDSIENIGSIIEAKVKAAQHAVNVEEIQDMVEYEIDKLGAFNLAKSYILYRYKHTQDRNLSTLEANILSMINDANEELKQENSNKDTRILSTQRDYAAGEVSKLITKHKVFSNFLIDLHNKGIIHIHDTVYLSFILMISFLNS